MKRIKWNFFKEGVIGPLEAGIAAKQQLYKCEIDTLNMIKNTVLCVVQGEEELSYDKSGGRVDVVKGFKLLLCSPILFTVTSLSKLTVFAITTLLILGGGMVGATCDVVSHCASDTSTPTNRR